MTYIKPPLTRTAQEPTTQTLPLKQALPPRPGKWPAGNGGTGLPTAKRINSVAGIRGADEAAGQLKQPC